MKPNNRGKQTTATPHNDLIKEMIKTSRDYLRAGLTESEVRLCLQDYIKTNLPRIHPIDFIEWIRDSPQYSFYFYDAQESGVCAKPAEMAALILETIALDALDSAS